MYSNSNSDCNYSSSTHPNPNPNPTSYCCYTNTSQAVIPVVCRPFTCSNNDIIINPSSKLEDSSFSHYPSPYMHYEDDAIFTAYLKDIVLQEQHHFTAADDHQEDTAAAAVAETTVMDDTNKDSTNDINKEDAILEIQQQQQQQQIPRKRSSKKDRHSKINTAQGPRDRRMRLSLDVARKFFDLQDMLGFDKASKTVEWLIIKSRTAIKEVVRGLPHMRHSCSYFGGGANSTSSNSECGEVMSGLEELSATNENQLLQTDFSRNKKVQLMKPSCSTDKDHKKKSTRAARRIGFHFVGKESRKRARERARERTREKRRINESTKNNHDLSLMKSWSSFETGEESGTHRGRGRDFAGDPLMATSSWNPSSIMIYPHRISDDDQNIGFTNIQF